MGRNIFICAGGGVLLLALGMAVFIFIAKKNTSQTGRVPRVETGEAQPGPQHETRGDGETPADPVATNAAATAAANTGAELTGGEPDKTDALKAFLEEWQNAMDDNDDARIHAESAKLMKHPDPEVRKHAVDGFAWIGLKGLVPLAEMMYDRDPEVARNAAEAWLEEIADMKDDASKAEILGLAGANVDRLDEETFAELLAAFDEIPEHLAAQQIYAMLQTSQNPSYIEEMLDALQFIVQPDEPFGETFTLAAKKAIEEWIEQNKNNPVEDEDDDE